MVARNVMLAQWLIKVGYSGVMCSLLLLSGVPSSTAFRTINTCPLLANSMLPRTSLHKHAVVNTEAVVKDYADNIMNTYGRFPLAISHGCGATLFDLAGMEYQDFAAGIATCCLGHSPPALKEAIMKQLDKVHHCSNLYYIPEQAALAKWLVKNSCADKAFFCNSGAEANEAAIKLARKHAYTKLIQKDTETPIIITALNSFHGRTLTAITATGQPKYQKYFGPLTPGFEYTPYNDVGALKDLVQRIQSQGNVLAAIMMEPLQGEGGIKPGDPSFFKGVRDICDTTGALFICDEVQTGVGRTGEMWGYQHLEGVEPDVITSAKAIGAGIPLGAMLCKEKCNVFEPGDHASTYGGNPLACAAGLAVADAFDSQALLQNVKERSIQFNSLAQNLKNKFPNIITEVRGRGLINGIAISEDSDITAAAVTNALLSEGVLVVPAGVKVVRFVPPLIITETEMNKAFEKVDLVFSKLSASS